MSVFKGFSIKLPVYTVITPQTGRSFDVRSLTVAEVSKLKSSLVTPSRATIIVDNMLWDSIDSKPEGWTVDIFKKNVTIKDREALLYGLYHVSFGDSRSISVYCTSCGQQQTIDIKLGSHFGMEAYPGSAGIKNSYIVGRASGENPIDEEIEVSIKKDQLKKSKTTAPKGMPAEIAATENLDISKEDEEFGVVNKVETAIDAPSEENNSDNIIDKVLRIELPISKVFAYVKQPTIADEESLLNTIPYATKKQSDVSTDTLIIEKFEMIKPDGKSEFVVNRQDIIWGYEELSPLDRDEIFKTYNENFGKYGINLNVGFECKSCGAISTNDLDITAHFFRIIASS